MPAFIRRVRQLLHWRRFDEDLAEEMSFHRDMAASAGESRGLDRDSALNAAHHAFGSESLAADRARDVWIPVGLRDWTADARFAWRLMWKERGFTAAAVVTLALAIGIGATVYTVVNAMILRGLPVAQMKANLAAIVQSAKRRGARVILVGMQLPPNYGAQYVNEFRAAFRDVARDERVPFVPLLFEGVPDQREMFQADNLHPSAEAQPILMENVWRRLGAMGIGAPK